MPSKPDAKPCPVCRKPVADGFAPFCSPGCKSRDLLKWLGEGYRIAGPPADEQSRDSGRVDSDSGEG